MTASPKMDDEQPSEMLRECAFRLRRLAVAMPHILPIAENIERIAERQAEYERGRDGR